MEGGILDSAGNRLGDDDEDNDDDAKTYAPTTSNNLLEFHIAVLREAKLLGLLSDTLLELLTTWFVTDIIAPNTGETPDEVRDRLSIQ